MRAQAWLAERGLDARPILQQGSKSKAPDFAVHSDGTFAFFAEVKTIQKDRWLEDQLLEAEPGELVGGSRPDPTSNRISSKIHQACRQLRTVNPEGSHPNVLVFVSYESDCNFEDLRGVLTGRFFANDGSRHPVFLEHSEGRIRAERNDIDLYIWLEEDGTHHCLFNSIHEERSRVVARAFGVDLGALPSLM